MKCSITLTFNSQKDRRKFLKGLADGFGQEHCQLSWDGDDKGVSLLDTTIVHVIPEGPFEDDDEHDDYGFTRLVGDEG